MVPGCSPARAEGAAQTQGVEETLVEERLLRQEPGDAGLGVDRGVEVLAEGAVVVEAEGAGDVEPLLERELLLHISPDGARFDGGVPGLRAPRAGDGLGAGRQHASGRERAAREVAEELAAEGRLGPDVLCQLESGARRQVHGGLGDLEPVVVLLPPQLVQVVRDLAGGPELLVLPIGDVVSQRGAGGEPAQRPPVAGEPTDEPLDRLGVPVGEELGGDEVPAPVEVFRVAAGLAAAGDGLEAVVVLESRVSLEV